MPSNDLLVPFFRRSGPMNQTLIACLFLLLTILVPIGIQEQVAFSQQLPSDRYALNIESFDAKTAASFRGLCVVNKDVIWASGSGGTVVRTTDAGKSWSKFDIPKSEKIEFRDIEAFDENRAVILGAGTPARVYSTTDGGESWQLGYENKDERVFFDAFSFWDEKHGIAFSDPLDRKIFVIQTADGGKSWRVSEKGSLPSALKNEAGFAASGTCLATFGKRQVWIGLGGKAAENETGFSRVAISNDNGVSWKMTRSTISRSESAGIFSLAFVDENTAVAVGGDYKQPELSKNTVSTTFDGGKTWNSADATGFRSCVAVGRFKTKKSTDWQAVLLATGTNGTDWSTDRGRKWSLASTKGFHALAFVKDTNVCWASGGNGSIARVTIKLK